MKILYAVQATANGHISRAMELLPHLQRYGKVDMFLSGQNSSLQLDAPIAYRSKGLSLFYTHYGTLHYTKLISKINPVSLYKEIHHLPVEKYDLIINDFEFITAQACALKKIPSIHFGHQASFVSDKTPRPKNKNLAGEFILKNYARATSYLGLHFKQYDHFILPPVIKESILKSTPTNKQHIVVYLPGYSNDILEKYLLPLRYADFQVFSAQTKRAARNSNITFQPIDRDRFTDKLISCQGIITGAGFETPAEARYLGKKLMVIPINGQYEQQCNAAALEQLGVDTFQSIKNNFADRFYTWINKPPQSMAEPWLDTKKIVERLMSQHLVPYFHFPDRVTR